MGFIHIIMLINMLRTLHNSLLSANIKKLQKKSRFKNNKVVKQLAIQKKGKIGKLTIFFPFHLFLFINQANQFLAVFGVYKVIRKGL